MKKPLHPISQAGCEGEIEFPLWDHAPFHMASLHKEFASCLLQALDRVDEWMDDHVDLMSHVMMTLTLSTWCFTSDMLAVRMKFSHHSLCCSASEQQSIAFLRYVQPCTAPDCTNKRFGKA